MSEAPAPTRRRPRGAPGKRGGLHDEILAAAERLLVATGDEGAVSIRAVADAVGCVPAAVYRHFEDKQALLFAVCQGHWAEFDAVMAAAAGAAGPDPVTQLHAQFRAYLRFGLDNPEHYRILFMTRPDEAPAGFAEEDLSGAAAFNRLVDTVARAMAAGEVTAGDPFVAACGLWMSVHGLTSLLLARPGFPWPGRDALVDHVCAVQLRGLSGAGRPGSRPNAAAARPRRGGAGRGSRG